MLLGSFNFNHELILAECLIPTYFNVDVAKLSKSPLSSPPYPKSRTKVMDFIIG